MKRVLIVSPYFPPVNAADMQRVRMSLPWFRGLGWEAEVLCVDPHFVDFPLDDLLLQTVPGDVPVHRVKALPKKWTSKFGLGSVALRALWFFRRKGNSLFEDKKFDLVYFSTTQFPVCILGPYWKRKFGMPYVIDIQDPWHSDYYQDKERGARPAKHWFSYRLNRWMEPRAMQHAAGVIAVSGAYVHTLQARYPRLRSISTAVIPFGASDQDMQIAAENAPAFPQLLQPGLVNIVYIGRGGPDMHMAVENFLAAFHRGLNDEPALFQKLRIHFIGTSYAPEGRQHPSFTALADALHIDPRYVSERPARIGFFHALATLQQADALFIPGSDDAAYTASKLYPYIQAKKPIFAIFHPQSSVVTLLRKITNANVHTLDEGRSALISKAGQFLSELAAGRLPAAAIDRHVFEDYSAREMTRRQVDVFNTVG